MGSSSLSSSSGSESAPGAFQFTIAWTACSISAYVGSASSNTGSPICERASGGGGGAFLRCCTFSAIDGWSAEDLVLSRLPNNLSHRRRMSRLSCNRLPFSSLMACYPSVFLPPRPTVLFRCLYRPLMSPCRRSVASSATYASNGSLCPCLSPLALPYTKLEVLSTLPRGVFGLALSACLPLFVQRRQERSSHCWPFAPPKPA